MDIRLREIIIFKVDGLNEEAVREELETMCKVLDVSDGTVGEGPDEEPIRAFLLDGTLGEMMKVKLHYHCWTKDHIMWPMTLGA